jgi:hypothetical protein
MPSKVTRLAYLESCIAKLNKRLGSLRRRRRMLARARPPKVCQVWGCFSPLYRKGMCEEHYGRGRRNTKVVRPQAAAGAQS